MAELTAYLQVYAFERLDAVRKQDVSKGLDANHSLAVTRASVASLLGGEQTLGYGYPYAGTSQDKIAWADAQRGQMGLLESLAWTRDRSVNEQTYLDAKGKLRIGDEQQGLANLGDPAIYFLTGSIGSTIRAVAATNGALQLTQGAKQAVEGDGWNSAGNIVLGALGVGALGASGKIGATSALSGDLRAGSDLAGTIRNVNPGFPTTGRTHNCVNCAIATDATLSGFPASALPVNHTRGVPLSVLEKHFDAKFTGVMKPQAVELEMIRAGNGAQGILFGTYAGESVGHVFNVVDQKGVVRYLDGQTGKPARLEDFSLLRILRTK
ncbi:toxin glutamine deamidase domain-containing protein [Pseudomonas soli]|uniref:toxin glutamine deamidase domain-containing protein n=1 Tax=Pseudomonas soli TaxID=1306993 RepID=UPI003807AE4F